MILLETSRFLALDKPSGLSMATPRGREREAVERLVEAAGLPAGASRELLLVHRLDVGTSGVVLLAKDSEAHRATSLLFQERRVEKAYRAIVWGHPKPCRGPHRLAPRDGPRGPAKDEGRPKKASPPRPTIERSSGCTSVAHIELSPRTGRTHQIRVHLASRGHPIAGDDLYGGPRWRGVREPALRRILREVSRLLLHAYRLEFADPFSGEAVRIQSPEPSLFAEIVAASRG